jgi:hypothetical protein
VAAATTDSYTGVGKHSWIVPPGVTQLTIEVAGAGGGSDAGGNGCTPGAGAVLQGTVTVPQGAQLTIDVGGRGGDAPVGGAGGAAGGGGDLDGGAGGSAATAGNGGPVGGGGGGGGTMISSTAGPIVVAGGGGGCGGFASPAGFGLGGAHGVLGGNGSQNAGGGGADTGATSPAGGPSDPTTEPGGSAGSGTAGGAGAGASGLHYGGGGGGGGSAGGGGGGGAEPLHGIAGGGGGGSDLVPSGVTVASQASTGNGHVTISYASSWVGTVVGKVFVPQNYPPVRNGYTLLQTGVDPGSAWIVPSERRDNAVGLRDARAGTRRAGIEGGPRPARHHRRGESPDRRQQPGRVAPAEPAERRERAHPGAGRRRARRLPRRERQHRERAERLLPRFCGRGER